MQITRLARMGLLSLVALFTAGQARSQVDDQAEYDVAVPQALRGPFISDTFLYGATR